MNIKTKLLLIKILHTSIWAVMASMIVYILIAGIFNIQNLLVYISIATILGESLVLLFFKWHCPLTLVAYKYTKNHEDGFDIFLPKFVARNNKTIFSIIFVIGLALVVWRRM